MSKRKRQYDTPSSMFLGKTEKPRYLAYLEKSATSVGHRRRRLMVDIMLQTGIRAEEICSLKVKNTPAEIDDNVIEIKKGKYEKDRTIPIGPVLVEQIKKYVEGDRKKTTPRHIKKGDTNGRLFYNNGKRRMTRNGVYKMITRSIKAAGIKRLIYPHILRHTFASDCMDEGVPLKVLQMWMGHKDLLTTERYLHVVNDSQFEYATALEKRHLAAKVHLL